MANLLLLTTSPKQYAKLLSYLETQGHAHHAASDAKGAGAMVKMRAPDVVLTDASGVGIVQDLIAGHVLEGVPAVLLVTPERLEGLELPDEVSDFLVTTATPAEIRARMRCVLRRTHKRSEGKKIVLGDIEIDSERYVVTVQGKAVALTLKEFELLRFLAENRGRVFTREALLKKIWSYDYYGGTRTVDVHVRRLRLKIETDPTVPAIATVRGVGYKVE